MDTSALFNLSYGLYIIGAKDGSRDVGCVVNTVTQSTSKPLTLTVCINRDNYTNSCIKKSKEFSVSILSEKTKESVFGIFGFSSSRERNKFDEVPCAYTASGLPYINEGVTGFLQCKVIETLENFSHTIFVAEITEAENLFKEVPMTYSYYHKVIRGKTPKAASSYIAETDKTANQPEKKEIYVCSLCAYEYPGGREEFENLPDDYVCPICGVSKGKFHLK